MEKVRGIRDSRVVKIGRPSACCSRPTFSGVSVVEDVTDAEAEQIVAFLESLTGEGPEITLPSLPVETNATPRPSSEIVVQ